ncbi:MAG: bifunctional (p)ppGpp synthetase/guanosine-3',5'-bis(diphosphate) 3'-pyrophosphohydrolase [Deltaproteobacteria bacterium]|nr:bifunctional (p)ppGpp synthetase/guanosine-3',5'-bis(diphosphate) 3'-pyrophosphohydrolase [Deltaproteobacteria bacterium]
MLALAELVERVREYHPAHIDIVKRAYQFAAHAHRGQMRKSGEPYLAHPVAVAGTIADLRLDTASVCVALLHDVVEDTAYGSADLEREFGAEIALLVDGVTKLSKIDFLSKQDRQAESFRKMVAAMARDIRVLVVKLCDRLDNMRTLQFMSPEGQERIARETMEIYAPLASRLGFADFKNELEDLSFKYLEPQASASVGAELASTAAEREAHIAQVCRQLASRLAEQGFAAQVQGRPKHSYSIWRKMQERECEIEQIHDLVGFRVVVESVADCYGALGVVHSLWTPVPGRFRDYVALPKPNSYRSLHTTVFGPGHRRVEIQIRTHAMHRVAELGIAAHWRYAADISGGPDPEEAARFGWLQRLMESQAELKDPAEFIESVKTDLFQDEVLVFTPKGEVRAFPRGATAVDYAFAIHSDLGNHYAGARVNGTVVSSSQQLHNGDLVEVLTDLAAHPEREWLDHAVTARARSKIRAYLRLQQRRKSHRLGRELLSREMQERGLSLPRLEKTQPELDELMGRFGVRRPEELYVRIGYGKLKPQEVVEHLTRTQSRRGYREPPRAIREGRLESFVRRVTGRGSHGILLNGADDVLVRYTKCCNALPGDEIVGFMTRGRGITVHRRSCQKAFEADPERRVEVTWDPKAKISRPVKLHVTTASGPGILAAVEQTFQGQGISISEATCRTGPDGRATNTFTFLCSDLAQLRDVIRDLQKLGGVVAVERA